MSHTHSSVDIRISYKMPDNKRPPYTQNNIENGVVTSQYHHIVPRHLMYYLGIIIAVDAKNRIRLNLGSSQHIIEHIAYGVGRSFNEVDSALNAISYDESKNLYSVAHTDDFTDLSVRGKTNYTFFKYISWLPCNLFRGPDSKFRSDDPNQGFDKAPLHMPNGHSWLANITPFFSGKYPRSAPPNSVDSKREDRHVIINKDKLQPFAYEILSAIAKYNIKEIYDSHIGDWLIEGRSFYVSGHQLDYRKKDAEGYGKLHLATTVTPQVSKISRPKTKPTDGRFTILERTCSKDNTSFGFQRDKSILECLNGIEKESESGKR